MSTSNLVISNLECCFLVTGVISSFSIPVSPNKKLISSCIICAIQMIIKKYNTLTSFIEMLPTDTGVVRKLTRLLVKLW